eukprot:1175391-Prorocentrum_minimum.AAC.3
MDRQEYQYADSKFVPGVRTQSNQIVPEPDRLASSRGAVSLDVCHLKQQAEGSLGTSSLPCLLQ